MRMVVDEGEFLCREKQSLEDEKQALLSDSTAKALGITDTAAKAPHQLCSADVDDDVSPPLDISENGQTLCPSFFGDMASSATDRTSISMETAAGTIEQSILSSNAGIMTVHTKPFVFCVMTIKQKAMPCNAIV